jgi:trans-2,3-dihydro-3-hydroxyanthranilate isomerase
VFLDARDISDEQMQATARETNLSETTFILPPEQGGSARVRIFTPAEELPFAGHPVLGTALLVGFRDNATSVRLETGVGIVPVELECDPEGQAGSGTMEQPIPDIEPHDFEAQVLGAVGLERSELPVTLYRNGPRFLFVGFPTEEAVAAIEPDLNVLARLPLTGVSCFAGAGDRWKVRMFAPASGVAEDPATGSAAGPLALHLARHGKIPFGEEIEIRQGVEIHRPSLIRARVDGSAERVDRITVGGSAVVVARGSYRLA